MSFFRFFIFILLANCSSLQNSSEQTPGIEYPTERIVQSILDLKELNNYFHPKKENRVPLVLSSDNIPTTLNLIKFDRPVLIRSDKDLPEAYLRFTRFDCKNGNYCNVAFEYAVEKVKGSTGVFINPDGSYILEKTQVRKSQ